jgi:hypothetical protein
MGRTAVRLVARALVALCVAACAISGASAVAAEGGKTIGEAPDVDFGSVTRGHLYDSAFFSGYSVAFWNAPLVRGDRVTIKTDAAGGDTPPCNLLFMPGTDDLNVSGTSPLLDPASSSRDGTHSVQRFVATATGTYVLAMTNNDVYLSSPLQCLDAPSERPFTFKVDIAHRGSGKSSARKGGARTATPTPTGADAAPQLVETIMWLTAVPYFGDTRVKLQFK